jgi:hypothetical protein
MYETRRFSLTKYAQFSEIALNWNVSGTRLFFFPLILAFLFSVAIVPGRV